MSLATRCPVCATAFRVRAEQLAARGGRVRCGQCNHVFDGVTHLVTDAAAADASVSPDLSTVADVPVAEQPASGHVPKDDAAPLKADEGLEQQEPAAPPAEAPASDDAESVLLHDGAGDHLRTADQHAEPEPALAQLPDAPTDTSMDTAPAAAEAGTARSPHSPFSAYSSARRDGVIGQGAPFGLGTVVPLPAHAPAPRYRLLWGLLALLAFAALAAQGVWRYRTELGVLWPDARPYLEAACEFAGCTLRLPRHADLLAIEASDLQRDPARENFIVLNAVLRNRAQFPQEFPALELTLTDEASNAVVRRVLKPADYLDPRGLERAQAEGLRGGAEARLSVRLDASKVLASGYQLYLFYP